MVLTHIFRFSKYIIRNTNTILDLSCNLLYRTGNFPEMETSAIINDPLHWLNFVVTAHHIQPALADKKLTLRIFNLMISFISRYYMHHMFLIKSFIKISLINFRRIIFYALFFYDLVDIVWLKKIDFYFEHYSKWSLS